MKSKNFVFCENSSGSLDFVGDFEGLYKEVEDPWEQSGTGNMELYYKLNRNRLIRLVQDENPRYVLDCGCGLGFTTSQLSQKLPKSHVSGLDISKTAINKARELFPDLNFDVGDISSPSWELIGIKTDVLILNQLLWYILGDLSQVLLNCYNALQPNGTLIINNAFAREQRYGREILDGYSGAFQFLSTLSEWKLVAAHFYDDGHEHLDPHLVLKKA